MRRAAKVDATHVAIVDTFRRLGCFVQSLAAIGKGCPDLLVSYRNRWHVVECKDGAKSPSQRKLTPDQQEWTAKAKGPVYVCESVEDAVKLVQLLFT